jgi:hypothetical protein
MKKFLTNFILLFFSLIISLILVEFLFRYIVYENKNFLDIYNVSSNKNELRTSQPQIYDSEIGYSYNKNFYHKKHSNFGNSEFCTDNNGLRLNDCNKKISIYKKKDKYLFVGDSFIAGSEVGTKETAPYHFENISGYNALNGGVGGYSIIQILLRSNQIIKQEKISTLIFSFIPDDIARSEYSIYQGVPRPIYFPNQDIFKIKKKEKKDFEYFLKNKKIFDKKIKNLQRFNCYLCMEVYKVLSNNLYFYGLFKKTNISYKFFLKKISQELEKIKSRGINVIVFVEYPDYYFNDRKNKKSFIENLKKKDFFLTELSKNEINIIDTYNFMEKIYNNDKKKFLSFYVGNDRHMSSYGNYQMAKFLFDKISLKNE